MKCEVCDRTDAWRCPACGRVCCREHGSPDCPTCGRSVRPARRAEEASSAVQPPATPAAVGQVCGICGAPAIGACVTCGSWYCVKHRGVEALPDEPVEEGEAPRICWNCRLSGNAKSVLFWVAVAAVSFVALIYFLSLWV